MATKRIKRHEKSVRFSLAQASGWILIDIQLRNDLKLMQVQIIEIINFATSVSYY